MASGYDKWLSVVKAPGPYYPDGDTSGSDWTYLGPKNLTKQKNGIIVSLALDPTDESHQIIYAGTSASGLWKTTDGGLTWRNITGWSVPSGMGVNDILIDAADPQRIFLALGMAGAGRSFSYGAGILVSTTGGNSWELIDLEADNDSRPFLTRLIMNPENSNEILAFGKNYIFRIYLSPTITVEQVLPLPVNFCTNECAGYTANWVGPRVVTDAEIFDEKVFVSTDGFSFLDASSIMQYCSAKFWCIEHLFDTTIQPQFTEIQIPQITFIERILLDQSPAQPDKLFVASLQDSTLNVRCKVDFLIPNSLTPALFCYAQAPGTRWMFEFEMSNCEADRFFTGSIPFYSWKKSGTVAVRSQFHASNYDNYHADTRAMLCVGDEVSEYLFIGNDGGVSKGAREWSLADTTFTFTNINGHGLNISQLYGLSSCAHNAEYLSAGAQDNMGYHMGYDGPGQWGLIPVSPYGGDGYTSQSHLDVADKVLMFSGPGVASSKLFRTNNGFQTWDSLFHVNIVPGDTVKSNVKPLAIHPTNPNITYAGFQSVYRSSGWNQDFNVLFNKAQVGDSIGSENDVAAIALCEQNPETMYIAYNTLWPPCDFYIVKTNQAQSGNPPQWESIRSTAWPNINTFAFKYGITDLVVAPDDPNRIWISFGSFYQEDQSYWKVRIATSANGGTDFTYPSDGLPNLPVNCLTVWGSSETGYNLFAGNDLGVFKFDFQANRWLPFNKSLPPAVVTGIEHLEDEEGDRLRVSTYGYGVWETRLDCNDDGTYEVITGHETWSSDTIIRHNVYIAPGGSLTITARIGFIGNTGIHVKPGSQLYVNGGTLTGACGSLWNGISVAGDPKQPINNPLYQGYAELNDALVEHAVYGIRTTGISGEPDMSPSGAIAEPVVHPAGGIIKATNTVFQNNYTCVLINPCDRTKIDQFKACTFETTSTLPAPYHETRSLVVLNEVNQVHFQGCTFRTSKEFSPDKAVGTGIESNHSNFEVDPLCTNVVQNECTAWKRSDFFNLDYGIRALAYSPSRTFTVDQANFRGNNTGIYASAVSNAQITRDTFEIIKTDTLARDHFGGVYLDYCNGYIVEENMCTALTNSSNTWTIGVVVNNSNIGSYENANNQIYNNTFNNLKIGILAQNKNRDSTGGNGLTLKCNDFTNYYYDFAVTTDNPNVSEMGLKNPQGQSGILITYPAGNTFSGFMGYKPSDFRYHNEGGTFIYYHHDQTGSVKTVDPTPWYTDAGASMITLIPSLNISYNSKTECCPSHLFLGGGGGGIEELKVTMYGAAAGRDSVAALLSLLVDGGSTEDLKSDVDLSAPPDATALYSDLLNKSPYLSDTVMVSAINKETVLTPGMVADILSENPHAAKSDTILGELAMRTNPLTDEQMTEVMQGLFVTGAKEDLESAVAGFESDHALALYAILNHYTFDTLSTSPGDSLLSFTGNSSYLWAKYYRAMKFIEEGSTAAAAQEFDDVSSLSNFTQPMEAELNLYLQYADLLSDCYDSLGSLLIADSAAMTLLTQISAVPGTLPSVYASNVLRAAGALNYAEEYILPSGEMKSSGIIWKKIEKPGKSRLTVYPNPAKQYVVIEYRQSGSGSRALIRVSDLSGKPLQTFIRSSDHGFLVVPVNEYPNGVYIVDYTDGANRHSARFIVAR